MSSSLVKVLLRVFYFHSEVVNFFFDERIVLQHPLKREGLQSIWWLIHCSDNFCAFRSSNTRSSNVATRYLLIPASVFLLGRPYPVFLSHSLVWLVRAMLEITKIVGYHHCSLRASHPGFLLVMKVQLRVVAEVVLSHGTWRRRREESKYTSLWGHVYTCTCALIILLMWMLPPKDGCEITNTLLSSAKLFFIAVC